MSTLTDLIPDNLAKKVGMALFKEHRSKIEGVFKAATASEKELKNPEKLKEWLGIADEGSVGKTKVDVPAFKKKISLTITIVDYNKIISQLDKGNKWFEALSRFDPMPTVASRKKKIEKGYIAYGKAVADLGKDDPVTIKLAEKTVLPLGFLASELQDLAGYYKACKSVYPKHQKMFDEYAKLFDKAAKTFAAICSTVPHPDVTAEVFPHYLACQKIAGRCRTGRDLCKKVEKKSIKDLKSVEGYRIMFKVWLSHLSETLVPAKLKEAQSAITKAAKPYLGVFKKVLGA
ncbi:MAG: hypothetical protein AAGK77_09885 [Pseudomonadota bacterium]